MNGGRRFPKFGDEMFVSLAASATGRTKTSGRVCKTFKSNGQTTPYLGRSKENILDFNRSAATLAAEIQHVFRRKFSEAYDLEDDADVF